PHLVSAPAPAISFESDGSGWETFESSNLSAAEEMEEFERRQAKEAAPEPVVEPAAEFEEAEEIVEPVEPEEIVQPHVLSEAADAVDFSASYGRAPSFEEASRSVTSRDVGGISAPSFAVPADDLGFVSMAG